MKTNKKISKNKEKTLDIDVVNEIMSQDHPSNWIIMEGVNSFIENKKIGLCMENFLTYLEILK